MRSLAEQLAHLELAEDSAELLSALDDVPLTTLVVLRDRMIACTRRSPVQRAQLAVLHSEIHDRRSSIPYNAGNPWNDYDDRRLRRLFNAGETVAHIAGGIGRTQAGIQARAHRFGLQFQSDGRPLNDSIDREASELFQKMRRTQAAIELRKHG